MRELIIDHVMQTLEKNCVSASLAMVLQYDIDKITEEFHDRYCNQEINAWDYLDKAGLPYRRCMAAERVLKPDHVYIMAVPSANIPGGLHSLVVQMDSVGENWWILDPNNGREGRKVYGIDVDINGWSPDFEFNIEDLLEFWT